LNFKGKTILVTGGIGAALSLMLAQQGANLILNYKQDQESAKQHLKKIQTFSGDHLLLQADITSAKQTQRLFNKIQEKYGSLDMLVNNAGSMSTFDDIENPEAFSEMVNVNLLGPANVTSQAIRLMDSGKIVFVSSLLAKKGFGNPHALGYSTAKAGIENFAQILARDLAPNILVNCVSPGRTATERVLNSHKEDMTSFGQRQVLGRLVEPEEIAMAICHVLQNDGIVGEVISVHGGALT